MLIANNHQVDDWILLNRDLRGDFFGKILEMKFVLKSPRAIQTFLRNANNIRQTVQDIRRDLKFSKIFCRFDFGDFEPSVNLQKSLVDMQAGIFDEIAVQLIDDKFDEFKEVYEHASNTKSLSVSPVIDVATDSELLVQVLAYIVNESPENIRWKYRKITTYPENYRLISGALSETDIKYYIVSCRKRCGINYQGCENLCVPIILQMAFGFDGGCFDYRQAVKDSNNRKIGYPRDGTDRFDVNTYEWKKVNHSSNFRANRLTDFNAMDNADLSQPAINSRTKLRLLLQHLQTI